MDNVNRTPIVTALLLLVLMLVNVQSFGQTDFSGEWVNLIHEDSNERTPGPPLGDYLGIPLNEAGRMRAETHDALEWGLPEFQCRPHPAPYQWRAPSPMRIFKEIDPVSLELTAFQVYSVRNFARPIYMDGRPHPPEWAPHTWSGFSTGKWNGNTLVVTTTHLKESYLRRNGPTFSDEATVTEYLMRHGDLLTIVTIVNDPIYLEEPFLQSMNFRLDLHVELPYFHCTVVDENISRDVPHFLPGKNTNLTEWTAKDGIPEEAAKGGAETIYPEYRSKIKNKKPPN